MPHFSEELRSVARHVVWYKEADETLTDSVFFLTHLMTYGTIEDVVISKKYYPESAFLEALEHAPAGIFDPRSWSYWHVVFNYTTIPPLPKRFN